VPTGDIRDGEGNVLASYWKVDMPKEPVREKMHLKINFHGAAMS
jgi:hypothetical protein